jgi:hypothetical protein
VSDLGAGTASVYSGASAPASSRSLADYSYMTSYMTGFGQAAETMRDDNAGPPMAMADGAQPSSHRRSQSGGLEPATWFAGRDVGYVNSTSHDDGASPSRSRSSQGRSSLNGKEPAGSGSKNASYEEDIFAGHPTRSSSSQLIGSSSSDVGSSNGPRRSGEAKRPSAGQSQNPTPPTSYSLRKGASSGSNHSLKDILGRLRGSRGSSPGPIVPPEAVIQVTSPPPSASPTTLHFPTSAPSPPKPTSSPYGPITISTRSPTPPSSLLRPQSPGTSNFSHNRPTIVDPENGERLWPPLTLPPGPSPAVSDDSHEVSTPHGLLDPRLPWRLGQTRADSTTSLRDHEDYSRPIGKLVRRLHFP